MTTPPTQQVHRGSVGRPLAVVIGVLLVFLAVDLVLRGDGRAVPVGLATLALVGALVHATCWRPALVLGPDAVELRNVVRDVRVPWTRLSDAQVGMAFELVTEDGRRFTSWAVPGRDARGTARARARDRSRSVPVQDVARHDRMPTGELVAELVRARRAQRRREATDAPVAVQTAWLSVGPVLLAAAALLAAVLM